MFISNGGMSTVNIIDMYYISIILSFFIVMVLFINDLHIQNHRKRLITGNIEIIKRPLVSILIPAKNEDLFIKRCIDNIIKSTYTNYEIIIIAPGGLDNTFKVAKRLAQTRTKIKAIKQEPKGKNAALNEGLKWAKGEIIILMDADTLVEKEWLEHLITPIIIDRAMATSGNPYPYKCNWITAYHSMCSLFRIFRGKKSLFGAATVALKKNMIEKIGGFDETVHAADDLALYRRVKSLGCNIESVEKAKVKTDFSSTFVDFLKIETRWVRSLFHYNFNKKPFLNQILEPKEFIINYFTFISSIFFLCGITLFFLPNKTILVIIKIIYIFIFSMEFLRQLSKPFLLFLYTRNKFWLRYFYVPVIFRIASHFYTVYGMLTFYKSSKLFLGPRKLNMYRMHVHDNQNMLR